jgi:hypothetical protein
MNTEYYMDCYISKLEELFVYYSYAIHDLTLLVQSMKFLTTCLTADHEGFNSVLS